MKLVKIFLKMFLAKHHNNNDNLKVIFDKILIKNNIVFGIDF